MKGLFLWAAALLACAVRAATVTVQGTGVEKEYQQAVQSALAQAVAQVRGISITESRKLVAASVHTTGEKAVFSSTSDRTSQTSVTGDIERFRVTDAAQNPLTQSWTVSVEAEVRAPYRAPGLDPDDRRRMAVVPFRSASGDTLRWYGQADSAAAWAAALARRLNDHLTQTRKFTMLDRAFDAEVGAELARLSRPNAAAADAARLGQSLGTDYLVVGEVTFHAVNAPGVNPLTGRPLPVYSQPFAEVAYRVLLAPTGQLKWADTVKLDAVAFACSSLSEFVAATAEAAATQISDAVLSAILPFEIVGFTPSGLVLIGEGGKSLSVGDRLTVFALGEEVCDTRTGEVLDQIEEAAGDVEVVRVTEKMSYARVVGGDASRMSVGSRLRRAVAPPAPAAPAAPVPPTVIRNPGGGVVVPF